MAESVETARYGEVGLLHKINLVWFLMALFCIPVWWTTTTVTRFEIPYDKIEQLDSKNKQLNLSQKSLMTLSDNYDILVSLFLPDVYADWNIESSSIFIENWISKMSPVANFTISSQVIYHPGENIIQIRQDGSEGVKWSNSDLSNVINSLESHLQSNQNPNSKMVQLVAFVPNPNSAPLFFKDKKKSALLPDWGSFAILDVDYDELGSKMLIMDSVMKGFVSDMTILFGGKLDEIVHERTIQNIIAATNSLNSLSKLLQRVRNMVINNDVSVEIKESVEAIDEAVFHLNNGDRLEALKHSRRGYRKSESAFFDVSLLELLYFPQDQKFAIYVPLFLPVGIPILLGAVAAFKFYKTSKKLKSD